MRASFDRGARSRIRVAGKKEPPSRFHRILVVGSGVESTKKGIHFETGEGDGCISEKKRPAAGSAENLVERRREFRGLTK